LLPIFLVKGGEIMNKFIAGILVLLTAVLLVGVPAMAASTVIVTPSNTQGWSTADTRPGGSVQYVNDPTSPYPTGALQLTTDATNAAKAQYMKAENVALSSLTELGYSTKQVSGPAVADPSYQLAVDVNGAAPGGFTTLVYEPYWNGTVVPGTWQTWDTYAGQWWSSNTVTDGASCNLTSGAGGPPLYSLSALQTVCPNAVVLGFGVNVGTYNPNYVVEADGVNFNGTVYDFEEVAPTPTATPTPTPVGPPTDMNQCKNGGWQNFNNPTFRNQGQCVSYVQSNRH
jgi:hypothetical protein